MFYFVYTRFVNIYFWLFDGPIDVVLPWRLRMVYVCMEEEAFHLIISSPHVPAISLIYDYNFETKQSNTLSDFIYVHVIVW